MKLKETAASGSTTVAHLMSEDEAPVGNTTHAHSLLIWFQGREVMDVGNLPSCS